MATINLTDAQHELAQRELLKVASEDMHRAAEALHELQETGVWPAYSEADIAKTAVRLVRETLELLDALGWPADASEGTEL